MKPDSGSPGMPFKSQLLTWNMITTSRKYLEDKYIADHEMKYYLLLSVQINFVVFRESLRRMKWDVDSK